MSRYCDYCNLYPARKTLGMFPCKTLGIVRGTKVCRSCERRLLADAKKVAAA